MPNKQINLTLSNLPLDILFDIFTRLNFPFEFYRLIRVSKDFEKIITYCENKLSIKYLINEEDKISNQEKLHNKFPEVLNESASVYLKKKLQLQNQLWMELKNKNINITNEYNIDLNFFHHLPPHILNLFTHNKN